MKRFMLGLALLALCLTPLYFNLALAQQAAPSSPVTITGARGDAASRCDSATSGTQATITLQNPGAGQSNYITMVGVWGGASAATSAASPTVATLTGVAGTTPSLIPLQVVYPAAGAQGSVAGGYQPLTTPIKCLAGTACALVGPTAVTNLTQWVEVCYYSAP